MNLEASSFSQCVKHPSQFFTGFCSFCLVERLSGVDSVDRNPNPNPSPEIVELSNPTTNGETRVRRTLLSLFQMDDVSRNGNGAESSESTVRSHLEEERSKRAHQIEEGCFNCVIGGIHLERKRSLRHSSDWRSCREDPKDVPDRPRHSWDGSMMGKALSCSFAACLEESSRVGRAPVPVEKSPEEENNTSNVVRKKSHRWSRVWDWSITSPFRDLGKKRQHVLDRSMSESSTTMNGKVNIRPSQSLSKSVNGVGTEIQKFRPDLAKKREYRFGRSRSVHYTSPRNVDNGLLRFYLTPMRSSRSTSKGRTRTSRLFTKGLIGM